MLTDDVLLRFFQEQLEKAGMEEGLSDEEKERILKVFKMAMRDPYMDELQIYPKLIGKEPV
jgi:hypothetical protein